MAARWDNLDILRAIDRHQENFGGAAAGISGQDLMREIAGAYVVPQERWAGFVLELHIARDAGLLTFRPPYRVGGSPAPDPERDPNIYLQSIRDFALSVAGQDRARGRVVVQDLPDPAEDDGRLISSMTLGEIAGAIQEEYEPAQVEVFLREAGVPPTTLTLPDDVPLQDAHSVLLFLAGRSGSEGRRALRGFIGRWLDDQLPSGPTDELRSRIVEQLARQGWYVRDGRLVIGERAAGRRVGSPLLRDARLGALHSDVRTVAEPYVRDSYPAAAVFEAVKAINLRVKKLAGRDAEDGAGMMGSVFSTTKPRLLLADVTTQTGRDIQEGYRFWFMGVMSALRNPAAHEHFAALPETEAFEFLGFASALMRRLDTATSAPAPESP